VDIVVSEDVDIIIMSQCSAVY